MSTEENKDTANRIRQEELDAKQKEIVENLDNDSLKKESKKKEARQIGDSDHE